MFNSKARTETRTLRLYQWCNFLNLLFWEHPMIPLASRKILILFILAGVVITTYDVMLHSLFTLVHITFEWFELALEELINLVG